MSLGQMLFVHRQKILKGYKITKSRKINRTPQLKNELIFRERN